MGITTELDAYPSLVLGAASVSVLDMASAYSTFADYGEHREDYVVSKVTDAYGNVLFEHQVEGDKIFDDSVAEQVNFALSQVVESGTGTAAKIGQPVAGKTGTTDEYRDAWFVGYTCKLTTAVWMGYPDEGRLMEDVHGRSVTGGSFPAQIWQKYMAKATDGLESCPFPRPPASPTVPGTAPVVTGPTTTESTAPPSTTAPSSTLPPSTTTTSRLPSTTTTKRPPTSTTTTTVGQGGG
jgi:penicillin-binding protein 1A